VETFAVPLASNFVVKNSPVQAFLLVSIYRFRSLRIAPFAFLAALSCCSLPIAAQVIGPLPPPPSSAPASAASQPKLPASETAARRTTDSPISPELPSIPVDQIIAKFGEHEAEFKTERDNFTYTQTFVVQTIDDYSGQPDGEYRMTSDILFTSIGKRYEKVTYAPEPTLQRISLSEQDLDDLEHIQPFVLTSAELPKYDIKYVGRQRVDEIGTYVFDVAPKTIEKHQRYFQGRIWVDDRDLEIVKTDGKAVPDIHKRDNENLFPRFETYRQNIEGHYWFPVYTHADDVLHFSSGAVHIRMTVRYENYQRFGVTVKIKAANQLPSDQP
jgi:hypothetical protein